MKQIVPFNDLALHHANIKKDMRIAIDRVIDQSSFIRGEDVESFEKEFSKLIGTDYCISCANGTDALFIAMKSLNLKDGDEVIVPAHSWISTSETVTQAGGKVIFCDTDINEFTIDTSKIRGLISDRTVGIIPVHLYGNPCDMDEIEKIANENNLWIIEDCAQAHLAEYNGRKVGTFGKFATFSYYPGKNLGAIGDAGALVCNDKELSEKAACYARHGGLVKGSHVIEGINSRLDGIQAAVLNIKIKHLKDWTDKRRRVSEQYLKHLDGIKGLILPKVKDYSFHVWHLFVVQHEKRDDLKKFLADQGISTVTNCPVCLPLLPAYERYKFSLNDFPVASGHQSRILSLPIYPEITDDQILYVSNAVKEFCSKN